MDKKSVEERVKTRLPEAGAEIIKELVQTASDRLCIRLGEDSLPDAFKSICVDATVKLYRRLYYEGISSEGAANISTSFVADVLAEYERDIADWKRKKKDDSGAEGTLRFL